jgi:hypothetical protein
VTPVRLQGGPLDGRRGEFTETPERVYLLPHRDGFWAVWNVPKAGAEVYRRDEVDGDYLLYCWTDLSLDPGPVVEREKVPAGGWA